MSIESRWQLLPGPRPLMGFQSDLGRASLSWKDVLVHFMLQTDGYLFTRPDIVVVVCQSPYPNVVYI